MWTLLNRVGLSSVKSTQRLLGRSLSEFFENGVSLPVDKVRTGRAWSASELRVKSFSDLHKLWYVNLKERNLLFTQRAEAKRNQIAKDFFSNEGRYLKVKQNMARIRFVLNERRIAYDTAKRIQDAKQLAIANSKNIKNANVVDNQQVPTDN